VHRHAETDGLNRQDSWVGGWGAGREREAENGGIMLLEIVVNEV